MTPRRCHWVTSDPLYVAYHDQEWGTPVYDTNKLFEILCLESAQAGLSWLTVLKKRENYREAFDGFDPKKIAEYGEKEIELLVQNEGIIRHRGKIEAVIANAKAILNMERQGENFSRFVWSFVDGKPIVNHWTPQTVPTYTDTSERMSLALRRRGFKFVGKTVCYAFMQAAGLVDDHETQCFKKDP